MTDKKIDRQWVGWGAFIASVGILVVSFLMMLHARGCGG